MSVVAALVTQNIGAVIALIRNGACNVRTLTPILQESIGGGSSLSRINLIIGVSQGAATVLGSWKGVKMVKDGYGSMRRLRHWQQAVNEMGPSPEKDVMAAGVSAEMAASATMIISGLLEYAVALGFFVLSTSTLGYLDNVDLVIFALLVMNIALLFFLYQMWMGYNGALKEAEKKSKLAALMDEADFSDDGKAIMVLMTCFYDAGYGMGSLHEAIVAVDPAYKAVYATPGADAKLVEVESDAIETLLSELCLQVPMGESTIFNDVQSPKPKTTSRSPRGRSKSPARSSSKSPRARSTSKGPTPKKRAASRSRATSKPAASPGGTVTKAKVARSVAAYGLRRQAVEASSSATLELVYFILNTIAFYGYSLCILAFYFETSNESWHNALKFGMSHDDSDWWGNLAGDVAWTIEPAIALFVAFGKLMAPKKEKID